MYMLLKLLTLQRGDLVELRDMWTYKTLVCVITQVYYEDADTIGPRVTCQCLTKSGMIYANEYIYMARIMLRFEETA